MTQPSISRRTLLASAAAAAAVLPFAGLPIPAIAQVKPVKFTLAFLAGANAVYLYAGKARGIFAKHGIDIDISRGFGSLAAAQAIAAGRFDFGNVGTIPLILMATKGLPLTGVSVVSYDAGMGVGVPGDGPVTNPKLLSGKKIGNAPSSAEVPLFPAYAELAGFDPKKVDLVNTDPAVLERVVIDKQLDGMTGIASTSLPLFISKKVPVRWMLYSSVGLSAYGPSLVTTHGMVAKDPGLCQAMADATAESQAWALTNPDEATEIFLKQFPEQALNPDAKEFFKIGIGLNDQPIVSAESKTHGLGFADPAKLDQMAALVVKYVAAPDAKKPVTAEWFRSQFGGKVKLTSAQWAAVEARTAPFKKYMS